MRPAKFIGNRSMKNRLIIDSQLAARCSEDIFSENWNWPITQEQYDDPITEFIEWSDKLFEEIKDTPRLIDAFFLIKSDLLKDLSYYTSAWIDIGNAKQKGVELLYRPNEYIFESLVTDQFQKVLPKNQLRSIRSSGLTGKARSKLSRLKRSYSNKKSLITAKSNFYAISLNNLGKQIAPCTTSILKFSSDDVRQMRNRKSSFPNRLNELAIQISETLVLIISKHSTPPSKNFAKHAYFLALSYLTYGWTDAAMNPIFSKIKPQSTLITATGSGYSARLLSYQFLNDGHKVIRATHGGESPIFNDALLPTGEFPFASKYVAYGYSSAQSLQANINARIESDYPHYTHSVEAAGSDFHAQIYNRAVIKPEKKIELVTVVTGCFNGMYRVTPKMVLHDVVYMEWQRRLLLMTKKFGFTVIAKRHPKGNMSQMKIFSTAADHELLDTTMADVEQNTDAYVFDFQGSAFMEALCTLKPVVLIDIPIREMRAAARSQIMESVPMVPASFDERNRVRINPGELHEALKKPVDIDARKQLIHDFLLRPSVDFRQVFI
ncbi:MAG: hypothetical protein VYC65_05765 [Chloroflexota bacterium]|nr:hypothetical protein [Chloroflexota bacterium]